MDLIRDRIRLSRQPTPRQESWSTRSNALNTISYLALVNIFRLSSQQYLPQQAEWVFGYLRGRHYARLEQQAGVLLGDDLLCSRRFALLVGSCSSSLLLHDGSTVVLRLFVKLLLPPSIGGMPLSRALTRSN